MTAEQQYSVLMSVYYKEKAENLRTSMESIYNQTVPADDFVLICDGPLNKELDQIILEMQAKFGTILQVIRKTQNEGLGKALNEGLKHCKYEWVIRMDSDDISYPDRCERQLRFLREHPEISILSGPVEEFETDPAQIGSVRRLPETSAEIRKFARNRNPFNHPAVLYRKSAVEAVGGYQDFYLLEDYYLWIRMLNGGYDGRNLSEPLVKMRVGNGMHQRRAGLCYARSQARLFQYMYQIGWIGRTACLKSIGIRTIAAVLPNVVRKLLYEKALRK